MQVANIAGVAIRTICLGLAIVAPLGCAFGTEETKDTEPTAEAEQGWYSYYYEQHQEMTYYAADHAKGYGVSWDCFYDDYLVVSDYWGLLCDGNAATDDTTATGNHPFFISMWGATRADSNYHHFLREKGNTLDAACGNAVADIYNGTYKALAWRAQGDEVSFQRAIGAVTHAIQDSFAPSHARRDTSSPTYKRLTDLCSIHESIPGACQHPESTLNTGDDADDNVTLHNMAVNATIDYLIAVAKVASNSDPEAVDKAIQKWFQCPPLAWLPALTVL